MGPIGPPWHLGGCRSPYRNTQNYRRPPGSSACSTLARGPRARIFFVHPLVRSRAVLKTRERLVGGPGRHGRGDFPMVTLKLGSIIAGDLAPAAISGWLPFSWAS